MKFYVPEWDDKVDPGYDFISDSSSTQHKESHGDLDNYMWDIFGQENIPFDGLLVSVATISKNKRKFQEILENGAHAYFHLPKDIEIMGDCGAFSYIDEEYPSYTTQEAFDIYEKCGFRYGVSVDHLVVPAYQKESKKRMDITRTNGIEGLKLWKERYQDKFQLIVAIQGETIEDYISMYHDFLDEGATHVAFGSLVRAPTNFIVDLVKRIAKDINETGRKPTVIHFFGVARLPLLQHFKMLENTGVTVSFDSASYLRKAWLSSPNSESNYLSSETITNSYSAIRVPSTKIPKEGLNPTVEKRLEIEKLSLQKLRAYDKGEEPLDSVLETLRELLIIDNLDLKILDYYKRTLEDMPWKKCPCPICKNIGIEVVIFRGNNRNRRRGFHNVYSFYNQFESGDWGSTEVIDDRTSIKSNTQAHIISDLEDFSRGEKVLVLVGCSKKKADTCSPIPAKDLYKGNLFRFTREFAELMGYDYRIISAKYGLIEPDTLIETYDQVLRSYKDADTLRPGVEEKLQAIVQNYDKVLVIAGAAYRRTLERIETQNYYYLQPGGIGSFQKVLKKTLLEIINKTLDDYSN